MKPFFTFYGGKWRAAPRYPAPIYDTIVEPFCGAAGYSVRHHTKNIVLVERDPTIAALWRWLIKASPADILNLPLIQMDQSVHDLDVCAEARSLIGFWLNKATAAPCITPGAWMRGGIRPKSYWGPEIRARIASQVEGIKHWRLIEGDYTSAPPIVATWFIDPPYKDAGRHYRYSSRDISFEHLGEWCKVREGQVLVCENTGADWLPFTPFMAAKSALGQSNEALWQNTPATGFFS